MAYLIGEVLAFLAAAALVVLDHRFERNAVHPALSVDFLHRQLEPLAHGGAIEARLPAHGENRTDFVDLRI